MKQLYLLSMIILTISTKAQVGINTSTPAATLDVVAKNATATSVDGIIAPKIDRLRAFNMSGVPDGTLVYINNISTGSASGQTLNVTSTGYYYFEGTVWQKLNAGSITSTNIYNSNGELTGARTVTMGTNTINWNSSSTTSNAMNLNANSLTTGNALTISTSGLTTGSTVNITSSNGATNSNGIIKVANTSAPGAGTFATLQANNTAGSGMTILNNGNIGVGNNAPSTTLHVTGSARITHTPTSNSDSDRYLVVDNNGNILSKVSPQLRTTSLAVGGTTSFASYTVNDLYDFYFIDKTHTITLPTMPNSNFKGKLLRFYVYGGGGMNITINGVYNVNVGDNSGQASSGFSYSGSSVNITGNQNRFNFIDIICDGSSWFIDNRN